MKNAFPKKKKEKKEWYERWVEREEKLNNNNKKKKKSHNHVEEEIVEKWKKKKKKLLDKKIRGPQTELTTWSGIRPNLLCRLLKQWHGDTISCYFRSLYPNNRRNPSKLNIK